MKKKTIWLSYDLGVGGDYEHLYAWLDNHNAVECGASVACMKIDVPDSYRDDDLIIKIKEEIGKNVSIEERRSRIYCIRKNDDGGKSKIVGSFLFGSRKGSPWEGFGYRPSNSDEDE